MSYLILVLLIGLGLLVTYCVIMFIIAITLGNKIANLMEKW